jgi:hypothetical protein
MTSIQHKNLMTAQQKRFEVLFKRPENRECFDCLAKQPRWASTNLGVFFCLRCAGIHRSLGVHISKVKSTTMDLWEESMVQCCERIGNGNGKMLYEARLPASYRKPESSTDTAVVERILRQKYELKSFYAPEYEELRERMLAASPHTSAPTPVPSATPTSMLGPITPATPTFSVGVASPSALDNRGSSDDWTGFQSSPVTVSSVQPQQQRQPQASQSQMSGGKQEVDVWGDFATSGVTNSNVPQHSDLFGGPSLVPGRSTQQAGKPLDDLFSAVSVGPSSHQRSNNSSVHHPVAHHHLHQAPHVSSSATYNSPAQGAHAHFDLFDLKGPAPMSAHHHPRASHHHHPSSSLTAAAPQQLSLRPSGGGVDQSSPAAILAMFNNNNNNNNNGNSSCAQGPIMHTGQAPRQLPTSTSSTVPAALQDFF